MGSRLRPAVFPALSHLHLFALFSLTASAAWHGCRYFFTGEPARFRRRDLRPGGHQGYLVRCGLPSGPGPAAATDGASPPEPSAAGAAPEDACAAPAFGDPAAGWGKRGTPVVAIKCRRAIAHLILFHKMHVKPFGPGIESLP